MPHTGSDRGDLVTRKVYAKPGAQTALQAKAGIVVAALFLLFGLAFCFVVLRETDAPLAYLIGAFFFIWIVACSSIIIFYANLLIKRKNMEEGSLIDFYFEGNGNTDTSEVNDFESRLRKLEKLKQDGLITEKEYLDKRTQILQEKW